MVPCTGFVEYVFYGWNHNSSGQEQPLSNFITAPNSADQPVMWLCGENYDKMRVVYHPTNGVFP
jgi:hypothetical protein